MRSGLEVAWVILAVIGIADTRLWLSVEMWRTGKDIYRFLACELTKRNCMLSRRQVEPQREMKIAGVLLLLNEGLCCRETQFHSVSGTGAISYYMPLSSWCSESSRDSYFDSFVGSIEALLLGLDLTWFLSFSGRFSTDTCLQFDINSSATWQNFLSGCPRLCL
ncbi:hypothetical protein HG535_0E03580 [Zygotorulaspora mrakii]|uniref:Uncharacterized protein n=1 Tax=Zygotorulaspora mrakii TaxID=42260 RepID=A0A7H9B4I5_ZYGMR|nr:uncharacterized protein HG535_0E03580 [Zygotorulaspora mrakii]QLG73274.1 hypothetical protein HG535_0E03580 [Zygotorulaspora mrakii]